MSMAGLPPFLGFVGKETAFESVLVADVLPQWARIATTTTMVVGSILTLAYSIRFIWGAFGRKQLKRPSPAVQRFHAPGPLLLSARLAALVGDEAGAQASIKHVIDRYPDARELPQALYMLGQTGEATGQREAAVLAYRELRVLAPTSKRWGRFPRSRGGATTRSTSPLARRRRAAAGTRRARRRRG